MAQKIAIINFKGGVGKTTTAVNLGAALALAGKKVLLVDLDGQANTTKQMQYTPEEGDITIFDSMTDGKYQTPMQPYNRQKKLDFVPADNRLENISKFIEGRLHKEEIVRKLLMVWDSSYDFILMDCAPGLGNILSINAMCAADSIIIPVNRSSALDGMNDVLVGLEDIKAEVNPDLKLEGILFVDYNPHYNDCQDIDDAIDTAFPGYILPVKIRQDETFNNLAKNRMHIYEYNPNSRGAEDYQNLAKYIIKKYKTKK